ncbi:DNA polymerase I family protein with 3'-5'-exonuclease and polymerase domains [uncultured Woeseiaceae bacterium]|uniref:DNA-directed DNA polymerase n=1 Tax=uncultured Woeseiaceae bacterium TaxID=1983305 RepID=A0A7D9H3C1_9GAMM|nr:DNA polymerase I family protein with 3'-5'-exonuclease and polymerase domains [uncultured Woeseiaceae bacterium]
MSASQIRGFREVWLVDFEFQAPIGAHPTPVCMVAREWLTGTTIRLWKDDLEGRAYPPFSQRSDAVYVAYFASAEFSCHLALGWPLPANVLDLFVEFRTATNGLWLPHGVGILGALAYFGIPSLPIQTKEEMRALVMGGGPWSSAQEGQILDYCESDVIALEKLLPRMIGMIDVPRALHRGRYMKAVAVMESVGIPIDHELFDTLTGEWNSIKLELIREIDARYDIYEGTHFRRSAFERYLVNNDLRWPKLPTGNLDLKETTFKSMAKIYPELIPLKNLRNILAKMRLSRLPVGPDGRNRCLLSPFRSKTGRNQPSSSRFIFNCPSWQRGLIAPTEGRGLAYLDYAQQEFGIAAALSNDQRMQDVYRSEDPYVAFAKLANAVPQDATARSHPHERKQFKECQLGVQYGMGSATLAERIGQSRVEAENLLLIHHELFPDYWKWTQAVVDHSYLTGNIKTVFGWEFLVQDSTSSRTLQNFPMQANGAEILRLACCWLTECGVAVCAPVHDALLIEAPAGELRETVSQTRHLMERASAVVLDGFQLRTDAQIINYPNRFPISDEAGVWKQINGYLRTNASDCSHRRAPVPLINK